VTPRLVRLLLVFLLLPLSCARSSPTPAGAQPTAELRVAPIYPQMILVEAGSFKMGSDRGHPGEGPVHTVSLTRPFLIGQYEVTFDEYDRFCDDEVGRVSLRDDGRGRGDRPVFGVTWADAIAYCNWLSEKAGLTPAYSGKGKLVHCDFSADGYRLPTEAEWEYAARGGQQSRNHLYAGGDDPDQVSWYVTNSDGAAQPVGLKTPNELGLHDMSGNGWEWCWDWYGEGYYAAVPAIDPSGPPTGSDRVRRSGGWSQDADALRTTFRSADGPSYPGSNGLRLVRTVTFPVTSGQAPDQGETALALFGRLVDGTGAEPVPDGALVILGDRVIAAGRRGQVPVPAGAQVIELSQATILPGFINTHVHNAYNSDNLKRWAQAGVTTVRDLGDRRGVPYFSLRDKLNANVHHARLISAGPLVTVPGGYPIAGNNFPSLTVESPEDARAKIEALTDDGADVIKITLTSGSAPSLSAAEAEAIVATAHAHGVPVTVHATRARDVERALAAGVDDIAHLATDTVPDSVIRRMVAMDVSWVPTLEALRGEGAQNLARFVLAGGVVALGNDAGYLAGLEVGMPLRELGAMQRAGMTPMQIIIASTRDAARVCRRDSRLGTLEAGKLADILVVDGNPLEDLEALGRVLMVVHSGVVIRDER
jgi:formylglycine-generating enzyme required for sulfatase activity/imidazolonepropionase-like amidohydrolase